MIGGLSFSYIKTDKVLLKQQLNFPIIMHENVKSNYREI